MISMSVLRSALRILSVVVLFWPACTVTGKAYASDAASLNFVGRLNSAIKRAMAASGDMRGAARQLCEDLSGTALDLEAMMKTASAGAWERMGPPQREAYHAAFRRRIMKDCVTNAADYLRATVELVGVRSLPTGEKIIGTRTQNLEDAKILMWQVRSRESGKLMVTDVLVEGRSAILTLRQQASLSLAQNPGDIDALIDSLER
jgi:ABC-type transporter MlaC component